VGGAIARIDERFVITIGLAMLDKGSDKVLRWE